MTVKDKKLDYVIEKKEEMIMKVQELYENMKKLVEDDCGDYAIDFGGVASAEDVTIDTKYYDKIVQIGDAKSMKVVLIEEEPLYANYPGGEKLELFRKDFDRMEVGSEFKAEGWDKEVNATERTYVTVTCIFRNKNGVLLREHTLTVYYDGAYDDEEELQLVWVELKTEG